MTLRNEPMPRKIALPLLCAVIAIALPGRTCAQADDKPQRGEFKCGWAVVGHAPNGALHLYYDACQVQRDGSVRFAWILTNYQTEQAYVGKPYLSKLERRAFDCQRSRSALTSLVLRASAMGKGDTLLSRSLSQEQWEFQDAPPGSLGSMVVDQVCQVELK